MAPDQQAPAPTDTSIERSDTLDIPTVTLNLEDLHALDEAGPDSEESRAVFGSLAEGTKSVLIETPDGVPLGVYMLDPEDFLTRDRQASEALINSPEVPDNKKRSRKLGSELLDVVAVKSPQKTHLDVPLASDTLDDSSDTTTPQASENLQETNGQTSAEKTFEQKREIRKELEALADDVNPNIKRLSDSVDEGGQVIAKGLSMLEDSKDEIMEFARLVEYSDMDIFSAKSRLESLRDDMHSIVRSLARAPEEIPHIVNGAGAIVAQVESASSRLDQILVEQGDEQTKRDLTEISGIMQEVIDESNRIKVQGDDLITAVRRLISVLDGVIESFGRAPIDPTELRQLAMNMDRIHDDNSGMKQFSVNVQEKLGHVRGKMSNLGES